MKKITKNNVSCHLIQLYNVWKLSNNNNNGIALGLLRQRMSRTVVASANKEAVLIRYSRSIDQMVRWMGDDDDWPESEQCWAWWCHRFQSGYKSQLRRETAIRQRWCDTMPSPLYRDERWSMRCDADYAQQQQQQNRKTAERKRNKRMHVRLIECETFQVLYMRANTHQTNEPDTLNDGADPTDQSVEEEEETQSDDDVCEDLPVHGTNIQSIQQQHNNQWIDSVSVKSRRSTYSSLPECQRGIGWRSSKWPSPKPCNQSQCSPTTVNVTMSINQLIN